MEDRACWFTLPGHCGRHAFPPRITPQCSAEKMSTGGYPCSSLINFGWDGRARRHWLQSSAVSASQSRTPLRGTSLGSFQQDLSPGGVGAAGCRTQESLELGQEELANGEHGARQPWTSDTQLYKQARSLARPVGTEGRCRQCPAILPEAGIIWPLPRSPSGLFWTEGKGKSISQR